MNFTAVRGFNAYAQFSAKIRDAVKSRTDTPKESENEQDSSLFTYIEPVDTVSISKPARDAFAALAATQENSGSKPAPQEETNSLTLLREQSPHVEFREWARTSNLSSKLITGGFTQKIPGSTMNKVLSGSGISVDDNEEFDLNIDVLSAVTITSRNAEKAREIQNLMHTTPSGINWGMLLATLPRS